MNNTIATCVILMTQNCNMKCEHCFVVKHYNFLLPAVTTEDITNIINFVKKHKIRSIIFSGGEPTIELDIIEKIQMSLGDNYNYSIVTNGWFANNPNDILNRINLNEIKISFDKFHEKYISAKSIMLLAEAAQLKNIKVTIKGTAEKASDILFLEQFACKGFNIEISPLLTLPSPFENWEKCRIEESNTTNLSGAWLEYCPQKHSSPTSVFFVGNKGFTFCQGPLLNYGVNESFGYSNANSYENNELKQLMTHNTLGEQALKSGLKINHTYFSKLETCFACLFLHGKLIKPNLPSLFHLTNLKSYPQTLPANDKINPIQLECIMEKFHISYYYIGKINSRIEKNTNNFNNIIKEKNLTASDKEFFLNFIKTNYYPFAKKHYKEKELEGISKKISVALDTTSWQGIMFLKDNKPVAGLIAGEIDLKLNKTINFNKPYLWVYYVGYANNLLDKDLAKWIKSRFVEYLKAWSIKKSGIIGGAVYAFNQPSMKWFENIGAKIHAITIDKKK